MLSNKSGVQGFRTNHEKINHQREGGERIKLSLGSNKGKLKQEHLDLLEDRINKIGRNVTVQVPIQVYVF